MHDHPDPSDRARDDPGRHRLPDDGQAGRAARGVHGRPVRAVDQRHHGAERHRSSSTRPTAATPRSGSRCSSRSARRAPGRWEVVAESPLVDVQPYPRPGRPVPAHDLDPRDPRRDDRADDADLGAGPLDRPVDAALRLPAEPEPNCFHPPSTIAGAADRRRRARRTSATTRARGSSTARPRSRTRCRTTTTTTTHVTEDDEVSASPARSGLRWAAGSRKRLALGRQAVRCRRCPSRRARAGARPRSVRRSVATPPPPVAGPGAARATRRRRSVRARGSRRRVAARGGRRTSRARAGRRRRSRRRGPAERRGRGGRGGASWWLWSWSRRPPRAAHASPVGTVSGGAPAVSVAAAAAAARGQAAEARRRRPSTAMPDSGKTTE